MARKSAMYPRPIQQGDSLRIVFINSVRSWGGGEKWHVDTAAALAARGHDVHLYCRSKVVEQHARAAGVPVTKLPFLNDHDPLTIGFLAARLALWRPDALIMNAHRECWVGGAAAWLARIPVRVYRLGITGFEDKPIKARWYPYLITHWLAVCDPAAEELRAFPWLIPQQVQVMRNGVDTERFTPEGPTPLRAELGVTDEVCVLGMVSRLSGMKGHTVLLEALAEMPELAPAFHLAIAGIGRKEPEIRAAVENAGLDDRVTFLGFRDDIPELLRSLDVLVHPSISTEGMPHSVLEAMASGVPVVASHLAGIPDLVVDGETGSLVEPANVDALRAALAELIADPQRRRTMGRAGRMRATEHFSSASAAANLETYLRRICAGEAVAARYTEEGAQLFRSGRYERAIARWDDALAIAPYRAEARLHRHYGQAAVDAGIADREERLRITLPARDADSPRVSVIMPTYNRPGLLPYAIDSVLAQTFTDFELIIVNDGGTRDIEQAIHARDDARIRYEYAEHGGLSAALNIGLRRARGEFIAYLDDDDVWRPEHLASTVEYLDVHSDAHAVCTDMWRAWVTVDDGRRIIERREPFSRSHEARPDFRGGNRTPINAVVHRRACIAELGGFDTKLTHAMDWDMWVRLTRRWEMHHLCRTTGEVSMHAGGAQISADERGRNQAMINTIVYLNGLLPAAPDESSAVHASHRRATYTRLNVILRRHPEMMAHVNLRYLAQPDGSPYRVLYDVAKRARMHGTPLVERAALRAAMRCAPWELKLYGRYLQSYMPQG